MTLTRRQHDGDVTIGSVQDSMQVAAREPPAYNQTRRNFPSREPLPLRLNLRPAR